MTLTRRLLLLAFIAVLPAIVIWTYTEVSLRRAREAEVHDLALRQAQLAASELDRIFNGVRTFLVALSEVPAIKAGGPSDCVPYFTNLKAKLPQFASIVLLDEEGRVRCRQDWVPPDLRLSERFYFQQAKKTGEFTIGEYTVTEAQKKVLPLALPLGDATGGGVLVVALDLDWLGQELSERALPEGGSLTIADRNGTIFAREPLPERFVGTRIPEAFRNLANSDKPGTFEAVSQDGTKRIIGYLPSAFPPNGIYISAGLSSKIAFSAINSAAKRGFLLIGAAFVLALSLAGLSGRVFVTRPFETMLAAVRAWRKGNYGARIALPAGSGELGLLGRAFNDLMDDVARRQDALQASEERARLALEAGHMGTWWFDPQKRVFGWSPQTVALLGLPAEQTATAIGEWRDYIHPDDQADAKAVFEAVLRRGGDYEAEFRVRRPDGFFRWINTRGRAYLDAAGQASHMVGILHDVTARKEAEEQQRVLLGELNHRVKNTLATVQSIARQTLRASEPALFGEAFERRLLALSKTHDLLTRNAWREADFSAIVEQELMPHRRETNDRILVSGPEVRLPARAAINLGLVLHELVTNAAKYGALSVPSGRLELSWRVVAGGAGGPDLVVSWRESGGPAIAEPRRQGFGSRLIERSIEGELGGRIKLEYLSAGLVGVLEIPLSQALARQTELDRQDVPIAV